MLGVSLLGGFIAKALKTEYSSLPFRNLRFFRGKVFYSRACSTELAEFGGQHGTKEAGKTPVAFSRAKQASPATIHMRTKRLEYFFFEEFFGMIVKCGNCSMLANATSASG